MNESWWVRPEQLDEDQKSIIALPPNQNHLVVGPPGSGKTNLLLLRATYAIRSGQPNVVLIVFTRTLQEFIRSGATTYGIGADQIQTLTAWLMAFIREHGQKPETESDFAKLRASLVKQASDIADEHHLSGVFDLLLLDESQDYTPDEIKLFLRLSKFVFAAGDLEQKIYSTPDGITELKKQSVKTHTLRFHYRNGLEICKLADAVAKPMGHHHPLTPRSNYIEKANPSRYELVNCTDMTDAANKVCATLQTQTTAYPDEMLGVICPDNETLKEIWEHLKKSKLSPLCVYQSRAEGYVAITDKARICVSTIHSAKGLEFRTLHVLGLQSLAKTGRSFTRNTTYTAITRAKTALSLYSCGKVPNFLASAIASLQAPPSPPSLGDLFRPTNHAR